MGTSRLYPRAACCWQSISWQGLPTRNPPPFIWRRQLDYSILPDLKNWITHKPLSSDGLGFDVKRGAYGIRHIEMMTHLLQMLYGGKENKLQTHHSTDLALRRLADLGYLSAEQAVACWQDYWHWRLMEHRLQYCRDSYLSLTYQR